jgi:prepilin-type N-terminal cleavage/methylation domain-containing protein
LTYFKGYLVYATFKPSTKHQAPSTKHQAPSTKHHKRFKGFTLSELLVSLGVLGLIAGLTVPSIINSIETTKNRANLKEALQVVSAIVQAGVLNGEFQALTSFDIANQNGEGSITNYFAKKLNAKQCVNADGTKDITSDGCNRGWANYPATGNYNNHYGRWILPSGAKIAMDQPILVTQNFISFDIFANAYKKSYTHSGDKPDTISITCNLTESPYAQPYSPGKTVKPGMCEAYDEGYYRDQMSKALGLD